MVCHATYLINLGATDRAIRRKSIKALTDTLVTADMIDADGVVFHLGSHLGKGFNRALPRTVKAIETVLEDAPSGTRTRLLIENSAGTGGTMGVTLEEIQQVIDALGRHDIGGRVPGYLPPVRTRRGHHRSRDGSTTC